MQQEISQNPSVNKQTWVAPVLYKFNTDTSQWLALFNMIKENVPLNILMEKFKLDKKED